LGTVIGFTTLQWVIQLALDWHHPELFGLSSGQKIVNTLFQAASTRAAGFESIPIDLASPAVLVIIVGMMYISAYPVSLSIMHSNSKDEIEDPYYEHQPIPENNLTNQAKRVVFRDIFLLFVLFFIICIAENTKLREDPNYNLWFVLFEVVSAYGGVGLSAGYPTVFTSFSTVWSPFSRFLIIIIMIMGRHRGLPFSLDRALLLPSVQPFKKFELSSIQKSLDERSNIELSKNDKLSTDSDISP